MPERAEAIRRAHLLDVVDALRTYIEEGGAIALETEYVAADDARIVFAVALDRYYPTLQRLMQERVQVDPLA